MIARRILIAATLSCIVISTASAQFAPSDKSAAPGSNPMTGQQTPFSNITTKFDGIEVQVKRLIKDPTEDGAIRLIFLLSNSSKEDRRMLFLGPHTTLVDELGNVYNAGDTVGVEPCIYSNRWYEDVNWCGRSFGKVATRLAPSVPVTVAIKFKAAEGFSEELAKMSKTVSLRSRIGHYGEAFKDGKTADIIVNDIPFPR
jgi:hypothetical protein